MKLRVLSVGRDKSGLFQPAVDEYAARIRKQVRFELVELPASRERDPTRARADEARRLLEAAAGRRLIALDERGQALGSEEFASRLGALLEEARDVDFLIGGDEGLDPTVREAAERVLQLGPMTLPHRLARVVLVEQIYRALTIRRGEPYHK